MATWRPVVSERGYRRVLSPADAVAGHGTVPPGGTTGQVLVKLSDADYDVGWADPPGGGGGGGGGGLVGSLAFDSFWGL